MKIVDGKSGKVAVKFTQRFGKILCEVLTGEISAEAVIALLGNSTVEVFIESPSGTNQRIYKTNLLHQIEMSLRNEGLLNVYEHGKDQYAARFSIELSNEGALVPGPNEEVNVVFELDDKISSLTVNTLDVFFPGRSIIRYVPINSQGETPTTIDVLGANILFLPMEGLEKLEVEYPGGQRVQYTTEELVFMNEEMYPVTANLGGRIHSGALSLLAMPVGDAIAVYVTTAEKAKLYKLEEEILFTR